MVLTVTLPDEYPYVILSSTVAPFVTGFVLGGKVMRSLFAAFQPGPLVTPSPTKMHMHMHK